MSPHTKYNKSKITKDRYCNLFQHSPISIWEEDFSEVKRHLDNLKKKGVIDLREYFTSHPEDVLSLAQKVKIVAVNKATLKMFQARNEEELYRGLNLVFNKESYDIFREELIALSEGKTEFYSEAVNLTVKGEQRNILLKAVVLPGYEDTLSNVFIYIIDITDLKRLEAHLKESEEKYRKIVEVAHDAILLADAETGIILEVNEKAEKLVGRGKNEIVGMHFTQLHPREEADSYRRLFQHHVKEGRAVAERLQVLHSSGDRIPVSVSSSVITLKGEKCISANFRQLQKYESANMDKSIADCPSLLLSRRECEILKLIASGKSTKQMAQQMNISETTVGTHRMRIMQKLNMHKTADLVRYAIQSGLLGE